MHSFKSTLDFDTGKVGTTNHTQLKFEEATHLLCRGWLCGVIKRQKFSTRIFGTEFMSFSFGKEQEMNAQSVLI